MRLEILEQKICATKLTKIEGKVAEFISNNLQIACFMTATEMSHRLNVSDSSIIRLAKSLGYTGFPDMQKNLQAQIALKMEIANSDIKSPSEKLTKNMPYLNTDDIVTQCYNLAIENFKSVFAKNPPEKFHAAVDIIMNSNRKYVAGFRGCRGLADWTALLMSHTLADVIPNIHADSSAIECMLDASKKDCLILFSFARYAKMAENISHLAKTRKMKLIVITDKVTAPVAIGSDVQFIVDVNSLTFFNAHVAPTFIAETLITEISKRVSKDNKSRLELLEEYIKLSGMF